MSIDVDLTTMVAREFLTRGRGNVTEDGWAERCGVHPTKESA